MNNFIKKLKATNSNTLYVIPLISNAQKRSLKGTIFYIYQIQKSFSEISRQEFITIDDTPKWNRGRAIAQSLQVCGICRFMVRNTGAIKTHIFWRTRFWSLAPEREMSVSLQAFVRLEKMRMTNSISNWYQVQRNLFTLVIRK